VNKNVINPLSGADRLVWIWPTGFNLLIGTQTDFQPNQQIHDFKSSNPEEKDTFLTQYQSKNTFISHELG